jgi:tight adherence protein B
VTGEIAILELAGLLRAGVPASVARVEVESQINELDAKKLAQFEAIWALGLENGGSISGAMQNLSLVFAEQENHRREIELAFAGPRATARLVGLLPVCGLLLAQLFGLNPLAAIFTKPLALVAVILGVILLVVGNLWTRSILSKAESNGQDPGLFIDAVRFCLLAGVPFQVAMAKTEQIFGLMNSEQVDDSVHDELNHLAELNRESGASLAALLSSAARVRRETLRHAEATAVAKLSVKLMIPLGLLTLPSFILCAVVPIAIGLLSSGQNL